MIVPDKEVALLKAMKLGGNTVNSSQSEFTVFS